jgi:hypothetical protein
VLSLPNGEYLHTIELPWRGNVPGGIDTGGSCVPEGTYPLVADPYLAGGYESVKLNQVPDRTQIQVHIGNTAADVEGCIVVGKEKGEFAPEGHDRVLPAVLNSTEAYNDVFMPSVEGHLPTKIAVVSPEKIRPAGMEEFSNVSNLREHVSELDV